MRTLFRLVSRLLALLTLVLTLLYAYGAYLIKQAEEKDQALDAQIRSGNGFGGEAGFKIIDSNYSSREFFWIDKDHLLLKLHKPTPTDPTNWDNYIWNVSTGVTLPLEISGTAECFREGHLYHKTFVESQMSSRKRNNYDVIQSRLIRKPDKWSIEDQKNVREIWTDIPDRHDYAWRGDHECKPWYYIPMEKKLPTDTQRYYFRYLSEWGWIYRRPRMRGSQGSDNSQASGFYDIGESLYFGQKGIKRGTLPDLVFEDLRDIRIKYIEFLGSYWLANRVDRDRTKAKFLGLLNNEGTIFNLEWPSEWPLYDATPIPTIKGIFWSSDDYLSSNPGLNQSGGFLLTADHKIHKVIHGAAEYLALSPDGCKVAFYNRPKDTSTENSRLRILDTCNSSIQGREMTDVHYRNRPG